MANCILKSQTSSPDCSKSRVITASSFHSSSSVPAAVGNLLILSSLFITVCITPRREEGFYIQVCDLCLECNYLCRVVTHPLYIAHGFGIFSYSPQHLSCFLLYLLSLCGVHCMYDPVDHSADDTLIVHTHQGHSIVLFCFCHCTKLGTYTSASDTHWCQGGVGGEGTTTINKTPRHLARDAAAAACPTVQWFPAQLCPLQSHSSLGSLGNQKEGPRYQVQCCPNTRSLISRPPPSLTASIKRRFQGEETVDCSKRYIFKGSSSTVTTRIAWTLLNAFKGLGLNTRQEVPAWSEQFIWEVQ